MPILTSPLSRRSLIRSAAGAGAAVAFGALGASSATAASAAPWDAPFTLGQTKPQIDCVGCYGPIKTVITGNQTITQAGKVFRDTEFRGYVKVTAPGVQFINCLFSGPATRAAAGYPGWAGVVQCASSGTLLQYCTIKPTYPSYWTNGVDGYGVTVDRCDISQVTDGVSSKGDVIVTGCWIYSLAFWDGLNTSNGNGTDHATDWRFPGWSHNDCIQHYKGALTVQGCSLLAVAAQNVGTPWTLPVGGTSANSKGRTYPAYNWGDCLFTSPTQGRIQVTVKNNWMDGGDVSWLATKQGRGYDTGNTFTGLDNRFGLGQKPGYTGNPTNPRQAFSYDTSLGVWSLSGNKFDWVDSVPRGLQGTSVVPYYVTYGTERDVNVKV